MTEHGHKIKTSTPEQAKTVFESIEYLLLNGERIGDENVLPPLPINLPEAISKHFRDLKPGEEVKDSLFVSQFLDAESGKPRRVGPLATVAFLRTRENTGEPPETEGIQFIIVPGESDGIYEIERPPAVPNLPLETEISPGVESLFAYGPVSDKDGVSYDEAQAVIEAMSNPIDRTLATQT